MCLTGREELGAQGEGVCSSVFARACVVCNLEMSRKLFIPPDVPTHSLKCYTVCYSQEFKHKTGKNGCESVSTPQ